MFSYLLFDLDGTLFNFKKTEEMAFKALISEFVGVYKKSYFDKYKIINDKLWKEVEAGLLPVSEVRFKRFSEFMKDLNIDGDVNEWSEFFIKGLSEGAYLYEGSFETLEYLCEKFPMSVVSNGLIDVQYPRLKKSKINDFFEYVFISEEMKVAKPDKAYFDIVKSKINIKDHASVLMIGDSIKADIEGAKNAGFTTCFFDTNSSYSEEDIPSADYVINDIRSLIPLIHESHNE